MWSTPMIFLTVWPHAQFPPAVPFQNIPLIPCHLFLPFLEYLQYYTFRGLGLPWLLSLPYSSKSALCWRLKKGNWFVASIRDIHVTSSIVLPFHLIRASVTWLPSFKWDQVCNTDLAQLNLLHVHPNCVIPEQ